jgi:transcriptional regulator with XRE-family HTH domain
MKTRKRDPGALPAAESPDNLAALVRREQDQSGASYADIAKRSGLSKAKIGQIADPTSRYQLRPETIEKLATGLRLPLPVVRRAALVTAGVAEHHDPRTARTELIVHMLDQLDDDTLAMVEAMVSTAARRNG